MKRSEINDVITNATAFFQRNGWALPRGEKITIEPGIWHAFHGGSPECIIGEVSTANDDLNDNTFSDKRIGRFSTIVEDEAPFAKLVSDN